MVRVGIAVVLVIALMPMTWASSSLTYSGETPTSGDTSSPSPPFAPTTNAWDYCYTLTWNNAANVSVGNSWSIYVPFRPTNIACSGAIAGTGITGSTLTSLGGNGTWTVSYINHLLTFTATTVTGATAIGTSSYFQFWSTSPSNGGYPPLSSNYTSGTPTSGQWTDTGFGSFTNPNQLYTNPEPGGFALGAIVLGMAGGLWRRRPRRKASAA